MHHGLVDGGCIAYNLHDLPRRDACGLQSPLGRAVHARRSGRDFLQKTGVAAEAAPDLASPAVSALRAIFRRHLVLSWWHKRHLKTSRIYGSRQRRAQPGHRNQQRAPPKWVAKAGNPQFLLDDVCMIDAVITDALIRSAPALMAASLKRWYSLK